MMGVIVAFMASKTKGTHSPKPINI